jgi:hypothetical protein
LRQQLNQSQNHLEFATMWLRQEAQTLKEVSQ